MTDTDIYTVEDNPFGELVFFGWVCSFYSGKTRAYLRKAQVPYREIAIGHPHYTMKIAPPVGRPIVPIIQTREGVIVQDSTEIVDYIAANGLGERTLMPGTPLQDITALILDFIFSEYLARFNLYTRWVHYHKQESFIREQFGSSFGYTEHYGQAERDMLANMTRDRALQIIKLFGISHETHHLIDQQYRDLLDLLNAHFLHHPYLFGAAESVADCALEGALQPHLSRDPYPGMIMRERAPRVLRYAERMAQRDHDMPEYFDREPGTFVPDDNLPETLKPIITLAAQEYIPELKAAAEQFDQWAETQDIVPGKPLLPFKIERSMGKIEFRMRGIKAHSISQTNTMWALQRVHDAFDALAEEDQKAVRSALIPLGAAELLKIRPKNRLARKQYTEVWA